MNPNLVTVSWKKTILHRKASFKEWKRVNNPATLARVHVRKIWPLWYGNWFPQLPENQPLDVTTQIWVVLLIGWSKFPTRHEQSEVLARWNFCARLLDVFSQRNKWWRLKMFFDWENTLLDLHDWSDRTQPHPIIANHCFFYCLLGGNV